MNHLVVFAHPSKKSFNGAILEKYVDTLTSQGNNVTVRNLYESGFNPVLSQEEYEGFIKGIYSDEIKTEHECIRWSDVITWIYPFWWLAFPAILKGYIDRVFSYGFAYGLNGEDPVPLLSGKRAVTITTMGTPKERTDANGSMRALMLAMDHSIFDFCGLAVVEHVIFGNVVLATDYEREEMLDQIERLALKVNEKIQ